MFRAILAALLFVATLSMHSVTATSAPPKKAVKKSPPPKLADTAPAKPAIDVESLTAKPPSTQSWTVWEGLQAKLPEDERPYEIKGDRLGMPLPMFKARHHRRVKSTGSVRPLCTDADPDNDDASLMYRAYYAKAGVVHAVTATQDDIDDDKTLAPTLAGVKTLAYVYQFVDGELFAIVLLVPREEIENVAEAMVEKFGKPTSEDDDAFHWQNKVSRAMVSKDPDGSVLIVFAHKELFNKAQEQLRKAKPGNKDI